MSRGLVQAYCRICGKKLNGVSMSESSNGKWFCKAHSNDKSSLLFCEHGDRVLVKSLDCGWQQDQTMAQSHLHIGGVYTLDKLSIGRNHTDVFLMEVPDCSFNSVFFKRAEEQNE